MRYLLVVLVVVLAMLMTGCVGSIYTEMGPTVVKGTPFKGVLTYQPIPVRITYATYQLVAGTPKAVVGTAPNACTPVQTEKVERMPDYSTPYRVYYEPGFLESGKFSMTLEQGVLKTFNSEYTPGTSWI